MSNNVMYILFIQILFVFMALDFILQSFLRPNHVLLKVKVVIFNNNLFYKYFILSQFIAKFLNKLGVARAMIPEVKKYLISSRIGTKLLPLNLPAHQAVIELSARLQLACPITAIRGRQ